MINCTVNSCVVPAAMLALAGASRDVNVLDSMQPHCNNDTSIQNTIGNEAEAVSILSSEAFTLLPVSNGAEGGGGTHASD